MTRIAVLAIGILAVTAALALVVSAPLILFPTATDVGPAAPPPAATGEVGRVTAPRLHPERKPSHFAAPVIPAASGPAPTSALAASAGLAPHTADHAHALPLFRKGSSPPATSVADADDSTRLAEAKGKGNGKGEARGHDKPRHHGKAKGHDKPRHHGKAKGHAKPSPPTRLAFVPPRGSKSHHVDPPRAGRHAGRSARAHARARR